MRRSVKRKFTQYANVPTEMRGHLPNLNLYGADHRSLDTFCLIPGLCEIQRRNKKIAQRLQSVWETCRQHKFQFAA
jgi:hypothetical protein